MTTGTDRAAVRATRVAIAGNALLFGVKAAAGIATGSIALVSDALNSLVDIAVSVGIAYSVSVARRAPDQDHPFGHQRAEPLAALGVAIFTAILGVSVARAAVERLLGGVEPIRDPGWAVAALVLTLAPREATRQVNPYVDLGFRAERAGPDIRLTWNGRLPVVASAYGGTLRINDGGVYRSVELNAAQTRSGSLVYSPQSDDIEFRLEIYGEQNRFYGEGTRVILPARR